MICFKESFQNSIHRYFILQFQISNYTYQVIKHHLGGQLFPLQQQSIKY
jgi:hypothetical protein